MAALTADSMPCHWGPRGGIQSLKRLVLEMAVGISPTLWLMPWLISCLPKFISGPVAEFMVGLPLLM